MAQSGSVRVLISGATGMLGRALEARLSVPSAANFFHPQVYRLVRRAPEFERDIYWDPERGRIDVNALEGFDAVVHLAGENLAGPLGLGWSATKKHSIMESRRRGTTLLCQALANVKRKPSVLVAASGVGFYGSCGDDVVDETRPKGVSFLSDVAEVAEASTAAAARAGIRVVNTRFGIILSETGGVVERLRLPFSLGLGGRIGSGEQFVSWVSLEDAVRAIEFAMRRTDVAGPINVVSPQPVSMGDFTGALARALHRPALLPLPEWVVRTVFGEMGEETLLASTRAVPAALTAAGFHFEHGSIDEGLAAALHPTSELTCTPERVRRGASH